MNHIPPFLSTTIAFLHLHDCFTKAAVFLCVLIVMLMICLCFFLQRLKVLRDSSIYHEELLGQGSFGIVHKCTSNGVVFVRKKVSIDLSNIMCISQMWKFSTQMYIIWCRVCQEKSKYRYLSKVRCIPKMWKFCCNWCPN